MDTGYELLVFTTDAALSLEAVRDLVRRRLAGDGVHVAEAGPDRLLVRFGPWEARLYVSHEPHVRVEAREIAELFAGEDPARRAALEAAKARAEVSTDPDPPMDHFNDYLFLAEALQELQGAVLFQPASAEFFM